MTGEHPLGAAVAADPRFDDEYVRTCAGGDVLLVGVVHDHPASVHRVGVAVEEFDPDTVALEVPPLTVPLYAYHAEREDDDRGGEMSAAIEAAESASAVGIDGPNARFLVRLARRILAERPPLSALRSVASSVGSLTRHTCRARAAAIGARYFGRSIPQFSTEEHDCAPADPPARQAESQARAVSRSQSFLRAVELPHSMRLLDEVREAEMAARLARLREDGSVVAVVGQDHLDDVARTLDRRTGTGE